MFEHFWSTFQKQDFFVVNSVNCINSISLWTSFKHISKTNILVVNSVNGVNCKRLQCEKKKFTIPNFGNRGPTVGSKIPCTFILDNQNINMGKIYSLSDMNLINLVMFCQELASLFDKGGLSIVNLSLENISLRK